jgi:hypothetical protein
MGQKSNPPINAGFTATAYNAGETPANAMRFLRLSTLVLVAAAMPALADDDAPAVAKHKVTQSESYIMIEPMYATIMDGPRPSGLLLVAIGLDIPDAALRAETERALPLLRDDYIRSLAAFTWAHVRILQAPDVVGIADRLQRVTDRALHRAGARVLLAEVEARTTR